MELRVLRYFLTVAREENITRAAEALHITQPTLSRQLAQLEEEAGSPLFRRSSGSRKIILTPEGLLLRRRAEELLALETKTRHELEAQREELSGMVTIGCGEIGAVDWLAKAIRDFRTAHPLVRFELLTAANDEILEKIDEGLLDFGLLLGDPPSERYACLPIGEKEHWVLLLRADDPLAAREAVAPKDLRGRMLILPQGSNRHSPIIRWLGTEQSLTQAITCNLTGNAAVLVVNRLGIAPVMAGAVPFDPQLIVSRPLTPPLVTRATLLWKEGQPLSRAAQAALEAMMAD